MFTRAALNVDLSIVECELPVAFRMKHNYLQTVPIFGAIKCLLSFSLCLPADDDGGGHSIDDDILPMHFIRDFDVIFLFCFARKKMRMADGE